MASQAVHGLTNCDRGFNFLCPYFEGERLGVLASTNGCRGTMQEERKQDFFYPILRSRCLRQLLISTNVQVVETSGGATRYLQMFEKR